MRPRRSRAPVVVGRYALLDQIGEGATGSVWAAWDRRHRRLVAAKVLHPAPGAGDPALLMRFVHEQALRIQHPHVLTPLGWAAEDELVLLVTELVRGGSVRDLRARHGPLPEGCVALLLGQLLEALTAVHAHGVVHGDVKPANLLLHATGLARPHLLLADFGVATRPGDSVRLVATGPVGTPAYLPPEQVAGAAPHPSQDLYAAGVVARRLLAAPGPILTLVDSMTRTDPGLRPTAAQALSRLRELPVGRAGPWPEIPDRIGVGDRS